MRSLRERGNVERQALARRLEAGRSQRLERVKRIGVVAGDGARPSPVARERLG